MHHTSSRVYLAIEFPIQIFHFLFFFFFSALKGDIISNKMVLICTLRHNIVYDSMAFTKECSSFPVSCGFTGTRIGSHWYWNREWEGDNTLKQE